MSGLKIVLPTAFSDTALPILHDDPVLTEGSLVLVDPAHPANPWPVGVPVDGDALPNLAWKEASRAGVTGTQSALGVKYEKGSALTSGVGIVERSTLGGLHVIMSITATSGTGKGAGIRPAQGVADWMVAHPTHSYYLSLWFKMTRFGNEASTASGLSLNSGGSRNGQIFGAIGSNGNYPTGAARIGNRLTRAVWEPSTDAAVTPPFTDPIYGSVAVSGYTGTPSLTGSAAQQQMSMFSAGRFPPFDGGGAGMQSRLLWRAYLEDLTVSGRTYATVDALDFAEYTKQCLTAGGRYYGDTHTAATLA